MKLNGRLILLSILVSTISFGQQSDKFYRKMNFVNWEVQNEGNFLYEQEIPLKKRLEFKLKSVNYSYQNAKGKVTSKSTISFNSFGRMNSIQRKKSTSTFEYVQDTLPSKTTWIYGKNTTVTSRTYTNSKLTSLITLKNGKEIEVNQFTYTDFGKKKSQIFQHKKHEYRIDNEYNSEQKLQKTTYTVDGKVKKLWNYDCKPEGDLVSSKNEIMGSFCKSTEHNADGSYVIINRTVEKGKDYLYKNYYSADSVISSSEKFGSDGKLERRFTYEKGSEEIFFYKKNGDFRYGYIKRYDSDKNVIEHQSFRGKKKKESFHTVYVRNEIGLTVEIQALKNGRLKSKRVLEYTF